MTDYMGSEHAIGIQQRLHGLSADIAREPHLVNGGRLLHFLDPEATGWDVVRGHAAADQLVGFPLVDRESTIAAIKANLGEQWQTPDWLALRGAEDPVLSACRRIIDARSLPDGWSVGMDERPEDPQLTEVQALNAATGVSPYPAYYMRSEACPVLTVSIRDDDARLVATASVADRYHRESRLGGHVFAGMVSVDPSAQGKGLGKLVNALALTESHARFGWTVATEQVAANNAASLAMIRSCGLTDADGLVAVAAMLSGERFSR